MSSSNRTTSKGGKGTKGDTTTKTQKPEKTDTQKIEKNKSGKGSGDKNQSQQNSDSIRNAKYKDLRTEDPSIKEKVSTVIEMTQRSEEEVCFALHECGFDTNQAINMLFESSDQEWVTSVKKKKNRQAPSTNKTEGGQTNTEKGGDGGGMPDEWQEAPPISTGNEREKSRTRGGGPPRMKGRGGWRGRENRENEKNLESADGGPRRGGRMSNGPSRGGGSGRGGRGGGRLGSRTFQSRDGGGPRNRNNFPTSTMDTWNSNTVSNTGGTTEGENWDNDFPSPIDDWYNEEYTGSLAETKIFSSKQTNEPSDASGEKPSIPGELAPAQQDVPTTPQQISQALEMRNQQQLQQQSVGLAGQQQSVVQQQLNAQPMGVGTLTAAQSQYLSQLTQQTSESVKVQQNQQTAYSSNAQQYNNSPVNTYNSTNYTGVGSYGNMQEHSSVQQPLPVRTKTQRARVPPPSKIPSTAVEMPGDSNISYLDVQFGALDFGEETGFNALTDKYPSTNNTTSTIENTSSVPASNLDLSVSQSATLEGYTSSPPKQSQSQSSISSALSQSQLLSNTDSIPQASGDHISAVSGSYAQSRSSGATGSVPPAVPASTLDIGGGGKNSDVGGHTYSQSQTNSYQGYPSQKTNSSVYQTQNYNTNNYQSNSQVTSTSSYVSSQPTNSYVNSNSGSYNTPNAAGVNSYQNSSYSNSASSYQSGGGTAGAFPSITQASGTFPAAANSQSTYQQNSGQSVYGASTGLSNSSNYNVTSSNQYNSYNTSSSSATHNNHKISSGKEQSYDISTTSSSTATATTTTSVSASPALSLTNSQTAAGTKVTTSSAAKSGVVANIPPGVAPMMGTQYIMGQAGMPFYQQPMYSYEDLQMLQQRVPAHIGAYYDMTTYQTPTTLATGREGSIASGAYSTMSDSRFTRSDNNASPVPSTLSQQTSTQSHQAQTMLGAPTLPPGYAYFAYNAGMMPGSFQYGAPAIYPQMPAATNAHGSTNLSQYPKPSNYGSGYGSGYDALSQSQDYAKSGYVSGTQTQNKAGGVGANAVTTGSSVATDLSVMYGKSHAALGKVNSYEKQGFHSGTPPPFNLTANQSAGIAPSGTYGPQMYIPTMPHQQHHNTTLMHQPLHQMDMRHQARRMDSGSGTGQRSQSSNQAKTGAKQTYPNSYWNPA